MSSIKYGIQSVSGDFDRRPNKGSSKVSYVSGTAGASKSSGAMQKKPVGMTGTSHGSGKNGFGKPGPQKQGN